ncbi:hypothetical protein PRIC2_010550 [Phytophthora ramorum]
MAHTCTRSADHLAVKWHTQIKKLNELRAHGAAQGLPPPDAILNLITNVSDGLQAGRDRHEMHEAIRTHSMETGKLVKLRPSTPSRSSDTSDEDFDLLVVPQLELLLELHFELAREHPTTKMEKYWEKKTAGKLMQSSLPTPWVEAYTVLERVHPTHLPLHPSQADYGRHTAQHDEPAGCEHDMLPTFKNGCAVSSSAGEDLI